MKVFFAEKSRDKILAAIKSAMGDRELGKIVQFQMQNGSLEVVISKLGTSTLEFTDHERPNGVEFVLAKERIAFAHRVFKDEVTGKIRRVIEKAGGKVT